MTKFSKSKRKILHFTLSFYILIFAFCIFTKADAAELNLISQTQEINVSQQFQVALVLDTENEEINAVEGKVIFPGDLLELKEIQDGNSIINFWIERPKIEQSGIIDFSGIVPGGYQGTKGFLFSVVFRAKTSGSGAIEIRDTKVLLNDGEGTPATLKLFSFQFSSSQEVRAASPVVKALKDTEPPETFLPEIAKDELLFGGRWFLIFATQDKASGIDHYEIKETKCKIVGPGKWIKEESPYVLKDQELRSYIYVKAVDKAGNERIAIVEPKYPIKWYEIWWVWGIIIILIIIAGYIVRRIIKSKIKE